MDTRINSKYIYVKNLLILFLIIFSICGCIFIAPPQRFLIDRIKKEQDWAIRGGWALVIIWPYGEYHSSGGYAIGNANLYRQVNGRWKYFIKLFSVGPKNYTADLRPCWDMLWWDDNYVYICLYDGGYHPYLVKIDIEDKSIVKKKYFKYPTGEWVHWLLRYGDNNYLLMADWDIAMNQGGQIGVLKIDAKLNGKILCAKSAEIVAVKRGDDRGLLIEIGMVNNIIEIKWIDRENTARVMRINPDELAYEDCTVEIPSKKEKRN